MAASACSLSVEEVLQEVWNEEEMNEEIEVLPLEDVLKMCVDNFNCLRHSMSNYNGFKEDAKGMLRNVYSRHKTGVNAMDKVLMSYVPVWPMVSSEVCMWLKSIHRRLLANPRAANPWSIEVRRDLIEEIFLHIRHYVQEGVSAFGVTVENNRINFTEKKRLVRDLSKLSDIPKDDIVNTSLKKSFGGKREGFLAKVLVSTDKPFIISYDRKRRRVTLTCKYGCWNPFGYGFHE